MSSSFFCNLFFIFSLSLLPQFFLQWATSTVIVHFVAPRLPKFPGEEMAKVETQKGVGGGGGADDRVADAPKDNDQDAQTAREMLDEKGRQMIVIRDCVLSLMQQHS